MLWNEIWFVRSDCDQRWGVNGIWDKIFLEYKIYWYILVYCILVNIYEYYHLMVSGPNPSSNIRYIVYLWKSTTFVCLFFINCIVRISRVSCPKTRIWYLLNILQYLSHHYIVWHSMINGNEMIWFICQLRKKMRCPWYLGQAPPSSPLNTHKILSSLDA